MSVIHIISTTLWFSLSLFDFICSVNGEYCPSGIHCDHHEHCCSDGCCSNEDDYYYYGYGFYNLWYFWFVIIMIMMTCCGACSYMKKRQYYLRQQQQQQSLAQSGQIPGTNIHHQPPTTYGIHPSTMVPQPVGTFPAPPAYNEVTGKPDQFPKADFGYPNYGFAAPPYSPHETGLPSEPAAQTTEGSIPVHTSSADGTIAAQYPPSSATAYPPSAPMGVASAASPPSAPPAATSDSVPTSDPPPYTPSANAVPSVAPTDQSNPVA